MGQYSFQGVKGFEEKATYCVHNSEKSGVVVVKCTYLKGSKEKSTSKEIFVHFLSDYFMTKNRLLNIL